jgi:DNA-binding response OmpR family regulator
VATRILVVDDSPTIRRVVSTILEKHGYEPALASDGQDALEALVSGEVKTDLVLLDFVMPRMNGYQLCRALKDQAPELATLPIVLMSAKGDRIRDQFVQQTGAIDAITKPFDAQALVAVVENALRKVNTARASSTRLPEPSALGLVDQDDMPTSVGRSPTSAPPPPPVETDTRRTHVAQIVGQKLAQIAAKVLEDRPFARGTELEKALGERLSNEAILEMVEAVRDLMKDAPDGIVLSGDLAAIPIGAVLQLLQAENQSGVLYCRGGGVETVATFRGGLIDLVQSSGASDEFRLGRYFVEEGILTPEQIDEVLHKRAAQVPASDESNEALPLSRVLVKDSPSSPDTLREELRPTRERMSGYGPTGPMTIPGSPELIERLKEASAGPRPLGTMLLAAGKIVEAQLRVALTKQSNELLYDVLRWTRGRFELRRDPPSELAEQARLGLPVASVVMEGFRRVDEWRVLERTLGSFDAVLVRDDAAFGSLDVSSLPPREKMVLDLVDGDRTVRQIVVASHQSSFDACRTLVQFLEARVLRRR